MSDDGDMDIAAQRFALYRERYEGGGTISITALVAGLTASERDRFDSLVDAFLEEAPPRPFDAQAFERSRTAAAVRRSVRRAADGRNQDQ